MDVSEKVVKAVLDVTTNQKMDYKAGIDVIKKAADGFSPFIEPALEEPKQ